ncbi:hypothetical protein [Mariniflexile sp.]|uniref:hypothetical protein n=1 Tax=Mariniflexile sp. TaxID=1979402 RepID=UPI004048CBF5
MKKKLHKAMLSIILTMLFACNSTKTINIETVNEESPPKLVFLNYTISKGDNGKKNIQFINKKITDGKQKSNNNYVEIGGIGDLKCIQLDKDSTKITSVTIKDPLSRRIEFVNDSLIFENKKVELSKTSFSLRLQLHSQTKFIAIKEIIDSLQNTRTLIITKID